MYLCGFIEPKGSVSQQPVPYLSISCHPELLIFHPTYKDHKKKYSIRLYENFIKSTIKQVY